MKKTVVFVAWAVSFLSAAPAFAAGTTRIQFYGHAAFEVTTPSGKTLWIDPWLKNPLDPAAQGGKDPIASVEKGDYILVTHGHFDHVGDSVELAKKTHARLVTNFELGSAMAKVLGYPADQMGFDTLFNIGGTIPLADGEVKVTMVPAIHSSGLDVPGEAGKTQPAVYGGNPAGFVIQIKDGPTIYDTGDTAYFSDMKLIGDQFHPDLALVNIGGHFGMEPDMAARAVAAVRPKAVVPMHYKTFPVLTQDPAPFAKAVGHKAQVIVLQPGGTLEYVGKKLKK